MKENEKLVWDLILSNPHLTVMQLQAKSKLSLHNFINAVLNLQTLGYLIKSERIIINKNFGGIE